MRRSLLRLWLSGGAFSAAVALGCSHPSTGLAPGDLDLGLTSRSADHWPPPPDRTEALSAEPLAGGIVPASYCVVPAVTASAVPVQPIRLAAHTVQPGEGAALTPPLVAGPPANLPVLGRPQPVRRAPPLDTPQPSDAACKHAADHSWLIGRLQHAADSDAWSVRYATPEDDPRHGGALTLVAPGPMDGFHQGQLVRVEGQVVDAVRHDLEPGYRVRAIQLLLRP